MADTVIDGVVSREQLIFSLYEAAELEHNLMCTYLYAAFSLKDGEAEGLRPEEAEAVGHWRKAIIDVAIEEMGHLSAVWNITSALGGSPRFGRMNFPLDPGYLPAGIVVKLAPFTRSPSPSRRFKAGSARYALRPARSSARSTCTGTAPSATERSCAR